MPKDLDKTDFVILDLETTGLFPESGDRIIEIAAIKVRQGEVIGEFHSLINPQRPLSIEAYEINRIDEGMIKDAPALKEVLPGFLDFIKDSTLCIYNAGFDLGFLNRELSFIGEKISENTPILDVLIMARKLLPGLFGYSLKNVAASLNIEAPLLHRAKEDVAVTYKIFLHLLGLLEKKRITKLEDIHNLFGFNLELINQANLKKSACILQAIKLERNLKIRYFSRSSSEVTEREVRPTQIFQERGRDYLVGVCYLKNEERQFRIDAILRLEIL
ncbi:MAG: exonuclease domain-containing protein [Candidatus Omnitrophota bacterium]